MTNEVAVLGAGMHPWGKWGRNFVEYGVHASREALADAGVEWRDVQFIAGGETVRNGYPGYVAASSFAQALGWTGARVATCYAACASGAAAIDLARARILAGLDSAQLRGLGLASQQVWTQVQLWLQLHQLPSPPADGPPDRGGAGRRARACGPHRVVRRSRGASVAHDLLEQPCSQLLPAPGLGFGRGP